MNLKNYVFKFSICLLVISLFCTSIKAATLYLKPNAAQGKDAGLAISGANANYGTHPEFGATGWTCGGNPCYSRDLIQFDLSSIPAGSIINSASLSLYANPTPLNGNGTAMQGNNRATLRRVTSNWDEMTVTWNTMPTFTTQNQVILPQSTSPFQNYTSIDVKTLVQDMVDNPLGSFGFIIKLMDESPYSSMLFASSDYSDPTKWPEITIDYTPVQLTCNTYRANENNGKDAYLSSSAPAVNYGNHEELAGDAWTCAGNPCFGRGLIYFDISAIPSNAIVQSAALSLYANPAPLNGNGIAMQGGNQAELMRVTSPWLESTVTWNNAPSYTTQNKVIIPQSTSSFQDYPNMDVTVLVQDMVSNPSNSYGFFLKLVNEVFYSSMIFASTDYPNSNKHPSLEICYFLPTGIDQLAVANSRVDVYPNPFSSILNFEFQLKESSDITVFITDVTGRRLYSKDYPQLSSGRQALSANLESSGLTAGIYILNVVGNNFHATEKLIRE